MKIEHLQNFKNGWIIGYFDPSVFKTNQFEVAIHDLEAGHKSDNHYHKIATEYNFILHGKVKTDEGILGDKDLFIFEPKERTNIEFLEDTTLVVIKVPSVPEDKFYD